MTASGFCTPRRGEGLVPAPRMRFVALAMLCAGLAGCNAPQIATHVNPTVYVDVAALRGLHPAWRIGFSPLQAAVPVTPAASPSLPKPPLLPPRIVATAPLPETPAEREAPGRSSRRSPLAMLKAALDARNARILARDTRAIRSEAEVEMAKRRAALEAHRTLQDEELDAQIADAVLKRQLRAIAMQSRINILIGPARQKQEADLADLRREAAKQDRQFAIARTSLYNREAQEVYNFKHELTELVSQRVAVRAAELAAQTRDELSTYRAGIAKALQSTLPPPRERIGRKEGAARVAAPASPEAILGGARTLVEPAVTWPPEAGTAARTSRLVGLIDADLRRWCEAAGARRGWTVRFVPGPHRMNVTRAMADMLRREAGAL